LDTRWKSIKKALSFLLFFLGVSLTLWNVSGLLRRMPDRISPWASGKLLEEDYQQCWEFQNYITNRLESFFSIAVNGCPAGWNYYDWGTASTYSYPMTGTEYETAVSSGTAESDVVQEDSSWDYWEYSGFNGWDDEEYEAYMEEYERHMEEVYASGDWYAQNNWDWYGYDGWYQPEPEEQLTEEQKERRARQMEKMTRMFFASIEDDKNLLYSIYYDGKLLYSNSDLLVADGSMQTPEGYNFFLYFDGEKVRMVKDGNEIDIYGDGYYREESCDWYVPGYRNFPVSDEMKKAVICMAAAEDPVLYTTGIDKSGGYRQQNNSLYWMQYNNMMDRKILRRNVVGLAVGLALLFFSCFCRKDRREAMERIASVQGKIWVECKVLVIFLALYLGLREYIIYGGYGYGGLWGELVYSYDMSVTEVVREYGGALLSSLWYMPLFWVVLFWAVYLTVNDFRHNKEVWKQGLIAKCYNTCSARGLKLPLARRMVHRNAILLAGIAVCGVLMLIGVLYFVNEYSLWRYYDIWKIFLLCILLNFCLLAAACLVGSRNIRAARDVDALSSRIHDICNGDYTGIYSSSHKPAGSMGRTGDGMAAGAGGKAGGSGISGSGVMSGNGDASGSVGRSGSGVMSGNGDASGSGVMSGNGDASGSGSMSGNGGAQYAGRDLGDTMAQLENIRQGMASAVDEQMKSERMKVELIANVSHDIKTPLTSIISYVQFLKDEKDLPEHVQDYVKILDEKSQRLKNMVQDVFAVSKAASGELPMNMEKLDFGKLLRQTMADMDEEIKNSRVSFRTELPEEPVMIMADGQRMYRVFQNLFQNALKYSLDGSRVYVTLKTDGKLAVASVKNTSHMELDEDQNFTERFVRGDKSRTDGGSGLGLSIAQSFTEACGGQFGIEFNADLFIVRISFVTEE